jgi:hypothetical protein
MDRNAMSNVVAFAALAGGSAALLYLAVTGGGAAGVVLGYLAPLPLFLTGLWAGATAAALAGMIGAILTAALTGSDLAPLAFLATAALPAVLTAATALRETAETGDDAAESRWGRPGQTLTALVGVAAAGFFLAVLFAAGEEGGLKGATSRALTSVLKQLSELGQAPGSEALSGDAALWLAPALPGLVAVSWMLMSVVNGVLAQGVLARFGLNRRPSMRFADLTLPRRLSAAFGAAAAAALFLPDPLGFWGVNIALILATPLVFAGLATAHAFAEGRAARPALLVAFYVFLFIFGWPIALLVGLGVIETWTGLSRRLRARRLGRED